VTTVAPQVAGGQVTWRWSGVDASGHTAAAGVLYARERGTGRALALIRLR
jgi:hypothetical protein